jgi:hypothetical protein
MHSRCCDSLKLATPTEYWAQNCGDNRGKPSPAVGRYLSDGVAAGAERGRSGVAGDGFQRASRQAAAGFHGTDPGFDGASPAEVRAGFWRQPAPRAADQDTGRPFCDGKNPAHSRPNTSRSISAASFPNPCRRSIMPARRRRSRSSCSRRRGRCRVGRTEIAGFHRKSCRP